MLPALKKITPPNTQMLTGDYDFLWDDKIHNQKFQVKNLEFKKLLSTLATNRKTIFAFSNRSKLDIAKNMLNEL